MSERFTDEELQAIAEGAKARSSYEAHEVSGYIANEEGLSIVDCYNEEDVPFILDAIRALPQLHQQVQDLQAANAALQAQVGEWGKWENPEVLPALTKESWGDSYSPRCEVLVRESMVTYRKTSTGQTYWQDLETGGTVYPVIGWRYASDESPIFPYPTIYNESPTAAESEE